MSQQYSQLCQRIRILQQGGSPNTARIHLQRLRFTNFRGQGQSNVSMVLYTLSR